MDHLRIGRADRVGWIGGPKRFRLPKHVEAIRLRPEIANRTQDLAPFDLAIDSMYRSCDPVKRPVADT